MSSYDSDLHKLIQGNNILNFDCNQVQEKKKIGEGGFGKVMLGVYKSLKIAIKKLKHYDPKGLIREIQIQSKYSHPMIPRHYGVVKHHDYYDKFVILFIFSRETVFSTNLLFRYKFDFLRKF